MSSRAAARGTGFEYTEHRIRVTRTARWGLLGELADATEDVWLVLHGYGQLAAAFAAETTWPAAPHRAFVFPEALQRFYDGQADRPHADAPVVASWMTREARDDDIADNLGYLDTLAAEVHGRSPRARFAVLGFSQGAATAVRWAAARAAAGSPPSRLIVWGSSMPPDVPLDAGAPLRRVPTTIVAGTRDRWVTEKRLKAERARLDAAGFTADFVQFDGGHRIDDATLARLAG